MTGRRYRHRRRSRRNPYGHRHNPLYNADILDDARRLVEVITKHANEVGVPDTTIDPWNDDPSNTILPEDTSIPCTPLDIVAKALTPPGRPEEEFYNTQIMKSILVDDYARPEGKRYGDVVSAMEGSGLNQLAWSEGRPQIPADWTETTEIKTRFGSKPGPSALDDYFDNMGDQYDFDRDQFTSYFTPVSSRRMRRRRRFY